MKRLSIFLILTITLTIIIQSFFDIYSQEINKNHWDIDKEKLNVVTSISPITDIVKNIGGEKIHLSGLVPEGVDSHTFELVPSDAIKLSKANLVIINGLNLEMSIEKITNSLKAKNPQIEILKLADNTISEKDWIFDFSFPKKRGDPNPHLWLNLEYAMNFVNLIRDKLTEMDPQNSEYYFNNSKNYNNLLKKLDEGIKMSVKTIPLENRKLFTYHDSWAYFAPRYGINLIGALQPSDFGEPSPKDVAILIDQIRENQVPVIFASEVFPTNIIDQIAKESNITIVETLRDDDLPGREGDPYHSYVGMMLENMKNMIIPLGGNIDELVKINP